MNAERERWHALQLQLVALQREIIEASLPDYFAEPTCCDSQHLQVVTDGYMQHCDVDEDSINLEQPGYLNVRTDGWDDMTEDGYVTYLQCGNCLVVWRTPDELEWN